MGVGKKIEQLIEYRNRNVNDVAESISIPPSTLYSIIRRDNNKVKLDVLQDIADELSVTLDYFSSKPEANDYNKLTKEEIELIKSYRSLNRAGTKKVKDYIKDIKQIQHYCLESDITEE